MTYPDMERLYRFAIDDACREGECSTLHIAMDIALENSGSKLSCDGDAKERVSQVFAVADYMEQTGSEYMEMIEVVMRRAYDAGYDAAIADKGGAGK